MCHCIIVTEDKRDTNNSNNINAGAGCVVVFNSNTTSMRQNFYKAMTKVKILQDLV